MRKVRLARLFISPKAIKSFKKEKKKDLRITSNFVMLENSTPFHCKLCSFDSPFHIGGNVGDDRFFFSHEHLTNSMLKRDSLPFAKLDQGNFILFPPLMTQF